MSLVNAEFLRKTRKMAPDLRDVFYPIAEALQKRSEASVTRIEFDDLKKIVKDSWKRHKNEWN